MRIRGSPLAVLVGLAVWIGPVRADDSFAKLQKDFQSAQQRYYEQISKQQGDHSHQPTSPVNTPRDPVEEFAPRIRAYAEKMQGKSEAIPALMWLASTPSSSGFSPGQPSADQRWALERLTADHAADAQIGDSLQQLMYSSYVLGREPLIKLYEAVGEQNKSADARARALFNLGALLYQPAMGMPGAKSDADQVTADRKRAIELFRRIGKDFPNNPLANAAGNYIFEIEHLQIGMKAPEIEGLDVNEKKVALSQFKGQVVVLDYWGFW